MFIRAGDLLRKLGSGVRPTDGDAPSRAGGAGAFSGALAAARKGDARSGRGVRIPWDAEVTLTLPQEERIGEALDIAESEGLESLIAVIDGGAVEFDVDSRTSVGRLDARAGAVRNVRAAFVVLPSDEDEAPIRPWSDDEDAPATGDALLGVLRRVENRGVAASLVEAEASS